jgi:dihydroorotase-like cyclic amidohydrolase
MIAKETGARAYIVHLSSAAGVEAVERAQRAGVDLIAETCPQYLILDQGMEEQIGCWGKLAHRSGKKQIRSDCGRRYAAAASQRLAQITCRAIWLRSRMAEWMSRPGLPSGTEHLLPLLLSSGVSAGRLDMQALVRIGGENTAKVFGLYPRKGALQPGSDADLVIIDTKIEGQIGRDFYHGVAHEWSPYFGYPLHGLPTLTMVRGSVVMERGALVDERSHGRFLRRPYL